MQPHLATLRFEEGLMPLKTSMYDLCAPFANSRQCNSVLCFSQGHSEAVGAQILLCRILCTVTCLCVAKACLLGKHSTLLHTAQTCFGAHTPSMFYKAKTFYQSQLSGDEAAFLVVPPEVFWIIMQSQSKIGETPLPINNIRLSSSKNVESQIKI